MIGARRPSSRGEIPLIRGETHSIGSEISSIGGETPQIGSKRSLVGGQRLPLGGERPPARFETPPIGPDSPCLLDSLFIVTCKHWCHCAAMCVCELPLSWSHNMVIMCTCMSTCMHEQLTPHVSLTPLYSYM